MGTGVKEPGTASFDIPLRRFKVILLTTNFLSKVRHNPYIIELIPLEFPAETRHHQKRRYLIKCYDRRKIMYLKRSRFSFMR